MEQLVRGTNKLLVTWQALCNAFARLSLIGYSTLVGHIPRVNAMDACTIVECMGFRVLTCGIFTALDEDQHKRQPTRVFSRQEQDEARFDSHSFGANICRLD